MSHMEVEQKAIADKNNFPKKITPSPLKQVNFEVRFESTVPSEAIFGLIYNQFNKEYTDIEKLPTLQIPELIRSQYPDLIFQPLYRLKKNAFSMNIGAKILSLSVVAPYPGWDSYFNECLRVFSEINKLKIISSISRIGLRYIDFFELDIFPNINLQIQLNNSITPTKEAYFRTLLTNDEYFSLLQIGNNLTLNDQGGKIDGSVIDIDTFSISIKENLIEQIKDFLDKSHLSSKALFFGLLKTEFLATLNPEY